MFKPRSSRINASRKERPYTAAERFYFVAASIDIDRCACVMLMCGVNQTRAGRHTLLGVSYIRRRCVCGPRSGPTGESLWLILPDMAGHKIPQASELVLWVFF